MEPHLRTLQREIASAVSGMTAQQLAWHPSQKWSSAEILEHLYLTYTGTIKGFGRILAAGHPVTSKPTWKNRAQAFIVVRFGFLPSGREAPPHSRPKGLQPEKVAGEIVAKVGEMDEVLSQCALEFGPRRKVLDHPFLGPFSVDQWRRFHLVHGRHHLKQLRRIRSLLKAISPQ